MSAPVVGVAVTKKAAEIKTIDGRTSNGVFDVRTVSNGERLAGATKWFSIFFAATVAAFFVPILHFVLMPALLIAGIVISTKVYSIRQRIAASEAHCPACAAAVIFNELAYRPQLKENCASCGYHLYVRFSEEIANADSALNETTGSRQHDNPRNDL